MRVDDGATTPGGDILNQAVLQELALAAPGQADSIHMEFARLRRQQKAGREAVTTDTPQNKVIFLALEQAG